LAAQQKRGGDVLSRPLLRDGDVEDLYIGPPVKKCTKLCTRSQRWKT